MSLFSIGRSLKKEIKNQHGCKKKKRNPQVGNVGKLEISKDDKN